MGKKTGFMDYERRSSEEISPLERITNYDEFHIPLTLEEQQQQGARCMDCGVPFCQSGMEIGGETSGCPLNNRIPEWNELIFRGCWELAFRRLSATNRFPEFTSRVCPALCEQACTCGWTTGSSVTVKENERTIVDMAYEKGWRKPAPPPVRTGKRVAVIGSGPSGLATADYLNKRGHNVTVYERSDRVGGLLMYGIPNMKLNKRTILRRVKIMEAEGIEFITGVNVGVDISAAELQASYDAVVLCCGASKPRDLNVPGRDAQGVYFAVDYLTSVTKSMMDSLFTDNQAIRAEGKHVLVLGGGDTANDCVATAVRQGCKSVTQLSRRPEPPKERPAGRMWPEPAHTLQVDYGQAEAAAVFGQDPRMYCSSVKELIKDESGALKAAVLNKLAEQKDSETGRVSMVPTGETVTIDCDMVLIASGFVGCENYVADAFGVEVTKKGNIADTEFATNVPKVYACGDVRRGASLVVWALREGRDAARVIDQALMGYTNL